MRENSIDKKEIEDYLCNPFFILDLVNYIIECCKNKEAKK